MSDTQNAQTDNAPVTQTGGETSTDISSSGQNTQVKSAQNGQAGQDATSAPEQDNNAQPVGDPRPFNQGQPEQPDKNG